MMKDFSLKTKLLLFCILFLGLFLRLYGTNWDQGWHLHPDERFLTMVGVAVKIPAILTQYLDQQVSSFNPGNKGFQFFVYGKFPLLINKIGAQLFSNDTYDLFNLQGRILAGIADFFIILIIYKLIKLVEKKIKLSPLIKYLSAFFYAIAVLPIQLSHFFTVDTFLNLFCWVSLYFAVKLLVHLSNAERKLSRWDRVLTTYYTFLSGIFLGLAMACKVSALYFAPLVGAIVMCGLIKRGKSYQLKFLIYGMFVFTLSCYLALRFGSPYYFETGFIFNTQLSKAFINSIHTLTLYDNPQSLFPPGIQWLSKSYDFPLKNIVFFGVGPFYFLFSVFGIFSLFKKNNKIVLISIGWFFLFLMYQSLQFAKTMRYFIVIYPLLAIFAAVGLDFTFNTIKKASYFLRYFLYILIFTLIFFWPVAFMSIYTKDHSRVTASKWMYENIPSNSSLTYEYWDDPLPLMVQPPATRNYRGIEVHIFDPDTKGKWDTINSQLKLVDYYIMSSNRGWGSISQVPNTYPQSSEFYKNMFHNANGFTLEKKFSSYPSLRYLGIPLDFPDQWAEEAFTVYDHPEVMIFKKT